MSTRHQSPRADANGSDSEDDDGKQPHQSTASVGLGGGSSGLGGGVGEAPPPPFSSDEVDQFKRDGFVLLKKAFTKDAAEEAKKSLWARIESDGVLASDASTWPRRHGISEIYFPSTSPWNRVVTPRLHAAIDQLCGRGRTGSFGCGWWVVSFPGVVDGPWGVDGNWHVDGGPKHETTLSTNQVACLAMTLFACATSPGITFAIFYTYLNSLYFTNKQVSGTATLLTALRSASCPFSFSTT